MMKLGIDPGDNIKLMRPDPGSIKVFRYPQSGKEVCIYENEVPKCDLGLTGFLWILGGIVNATWGMRGGSLPKGSPL